MAIRIRSEHDGYRKGGVPHTKSGQVFSDDHFTEEEMDQLEGDPRISIDPVSDELLTENTNPAAPSEDDDPPDSKGGPDIDNSTGSKSPESGDGGGNLDPPPDPIEIKLPSKKEVNGMKKSLLLNLAGGLLGIDVNKDMTNKEIRTAIFAEIERQKKEAEG